MNYWGNVEKMPPSMKHIFLAAVFAVATLTACSHKTVVAPTDTKVVKTCKKAK